jgi:hypothetical protein
MNKPLAWAYIRDGEFIDAIDDFEHARVEGDYTIPLYTYPVKALTADEITLLVDKVVNPNGCDIFTLIRAVEEAHGIRKAQEK